MKIMKSPQMGGGGGGRGYDMDLVKLNRIERDKGCLSHFYLFSEVP